MHRPGLLTALALSWYLALLVWLSPLVHPDRRPTFPPIDLRASSELLHLAVAVLQRADRLYAAQIGFSGQQPPEALAWQVIARSATADSLFKLLAGYPSRATQLYALAGLHRTDPSAYRRLAVEQRVIGGSMATVVGCVFREQPIGQLVDQMDRGRWTTELFFGHLIGGR